MNRWALLPTFALLLACDGGEEIGHATAPPAPRTSPIEETGLASSFVERLRRAHELADEAEEAMETDPTERRNDAKPKPTLEEALTALQRTLEMPATGDEADEARRDLCQRAARLLLASDQPERALSWISRGLSLGDEPTPSRASLLISQADAFEALHHPDQAKESLLSALAENQKLLAQELETP